MPYDENGKYYYVRASKMQCAICELKFMAGREPRPHDNGYRHCKDCRKKYGIGDPPWTPLQLLE